MNKIPVKNYIILVVIIIITFLIPFGLRNIYLQKIDYNLKNNDVMNFLFEVKEDELNNYLMENRDIIIYMSFSSSEVNSNFKDKLKKYVDNNELNKEIVYIDLDDVNDKFYIDFKNNYFNDNLKGGNNKLNKNSTILAVKESKVIDFISKENGSISFDETKKFIKKHTGD